MTNNFRPDFITGRFLAVAAFLIAGVLLLGSCKIYQPAFYFKDIKRDTVIAGFVNDEMELKIRKNDVLAISIFSLSTSEDLLFNKPVTLGEAEGKSGFQVNLDGSIFLHKLGKVTAEGLTRKELKAKLETSLQPYLKDPIVSINFANHRVTVLADASSMMVQMPEERISLLEVLATSKAASENSLLREVMVIRESKDSKEIKHLNLEDPSIFTSPWYYLQPNDIVVVKPNEEKLDDEQKRTKNQLLFSSILSAATFLIFILDRILR